MCFVCSLVVSADNSFKMYIDNKLINSGDLLNDLEPPIIPPKEIIDLTDRKPDDWDDQEKSVEQFLFECHTLIFLSSFLEFLMLLQRNPMVKTNKKLN